MIGETRPHFFSVVMLFGPTAVYADDMRSAADAYDLFHHELWRWGIIQVSSVSNLCDSD